MVIRSHIQSQHPTGISLDLQVTNQQSSRQTFFNNFMHNAQVFIWSSICPNSQKQYQIGWKHYLYFIEQFGTNVLMDMIPNEFTVAKATMNWNYSLPETIFIAFFNYLRITVDITPASIFSYMSGVRFMLKNHNMDTSFLDRSEALRAIRSGMTLMYRMQPGNRTSDCKTMAITTDMIKYGMDTLFNDNSLHSRAIRTALVTGYCLLMRISEYIVVPTTKHHLIGSSVLFGITDTSTNTLRFINSQEAHQYHHTSLKECIITIRTAKNDKFGLGHRFCFNRTNNPLPKQAFDISLILFEWAQHARPKGTSPFFSWNNGTVTLSRDDINLSIKNIARKFGFSDKQFSSHSLRIGGASVLAAANVPDYIIQTMGRWKSLAFLQYIRLSTAAFNKAVTVMTDISSFTSVDLTHVSASASILINNNNDEYDIDDEIDNNDE